MERAAGWQMPVPVKPKWVVDGHSIWSIAADNSPILKAEKFAMEVENKIRKEHEIPLRRAYEAINGVSTTYIEIK